MSLSDLCFDFLIEGSIKYHQNKQYESYYIFEKEVNKSLGIKNLKTYLNRKGLELKNLYKKSGGEIKLNN